MTDQTISHRHAAEALVGATRQIVDHSRTMVAWSVARLLATNSDLARPAMPCTHASRAPTEILLELLQSPCDLDVLTFIQRHPRALLAVDDIARAVGHDVDDVRASIQALTAVSLVACFKIREEDRGAPVLFYEFTPGNWDGILSSLLWVAASPHGRDALRRALAHARIPR